MTDKTVPDPTAEWLTENFSLDTAWPRPRAAAPVPVPVPESPKWRRTRAAARVAGQAASYALPAIVLTELVTSDEPGGGVWG